MKIQIVKHLAKCIVQRKRDKPNDSYHIGTGLKKTKVIEFH